MTLTEIQKLKQNARRYFQMQGVVDANIEILTNYMEQAYQMGMKDQIKEGISMEAEIILNDSKSVQSDLHQLYRDNYPDRDNQPLM